MQENTQNMLIMMKDTPVMRINFDEAVYDVLDEFHLPFQLKGCISKYEIKDNISSGEIQEVIREATAAAAENNGAVNRYLAQRVLPITRENAKKLYALFNFEQAQDDYSKAKIAVTCNAVSLQDNYWIKPEKDPATWKDVDIHQNPLNEIAARVALHGTALTLTETSITPELTTWGAFAKAWQRIDGNLYLYKKGAKDDTEARIEVMVSDLLKKTNVNNLEYTAGESEGCYVSKCECMSHDNVVMLSAMDFESYCNRNGLDFMGEVQRIDADSFFKMCIVDYLMANRDRHGMNWGFLYDCENMEILSCHPLYDHNKAFDEELMKNPDVPYSAFPSKTLREAARSAVNRTEVVFYEPVTRNDFLTDVQYRYFMKAAKELGLNVF